MFNSEARVWMGMFPMQGVDSIKKSVIDYGKDVKRGRPRTANGRTAVIMILCLVLAFPPNYPRGCHKRRNGHRQVGKPDPVVEYVLKAALLNAFCRAGP